MSDFDPLEGFEDIPEPAAVDTADTDDVGRIHELVEHLILAVHEAKTVPLSGQVRLEREPLLEYLEQIRDRLPEELRVARWMIRERKAFIGRTNEDAEQIRSQAKKVLEQARETAKELVSEHRIIEEAVQEANVLIRNAEVEAQSTRLRAEDLALSQLERIDHVLTSALREVRAELEEYREIRDPGPEPQGT
ncbi:MAG: hypothetical protein JSV07_01020 [Acidimicrobiia bacterium]|nr:MAG: hypothetical protein JSV07_01020 [Acidimicrobiia bacterium]